VVGSDHVPWFERLLRSRVAGTLALHSPCPVVVVPEDRSRDGAESAVVLTLDPESPLRSALLFAFRQADERGCVLQVLHATEPATLSGRADELHERVVAVLSEWIRAYPDVRVQLDDAIGDVADAIVRASRNAELVVVGRPHANALHAVLAQPTSLKVVRRSHCPVAVVPDVEDPREPLGG
ncbi:MAG: universal stress protein, partial [Actinomycetales bacterium]